MAHAEDVGDAGDVGVGIAAVAGGGPVRGDEAVLLPLPESGPRDPEARGNVVDPVDGSSRYAPGEQRILDYS
jgi:hypothetical protein